MHVGTYYEAPKLLIPVVHEGVRGVQLFFVASAFTLLWSFNKRKHERNPYRNYFLRRFFRIAPFYYLAIAFWVWFKGEGYFGSPETYSILQILSVALFANGWSPDTIHLIVPGGWSVVVEMNFYLLLPIFLHCVRTYRQSLWVGLATSIVALLISVFGYFWAPTYWSGNALVDAKGFFAGFWLPVSMPAFMAGMIAFFAWRENKLHCISGLGSLLAAIVSMVMVCYLSIPLKNIIFTPLLLIFFLGTIRSVPKILVNGITCFMGRISYSAYFIHFFVIDLCLFFTTSYFGGLTNEFFLMLGLTIFMTAVMSEITFRYIETPGRYVGQILIKRLSN